MVKKKNLLGVLAPSRGELKILLWGWLLLLVVLYLKGGGGGTVRNSRGEKKVFLLGMLAFSRGELKK